jgi:hypothetical protein
LSREVTYGNLEQTENFILAHIKKSMKNEQLLKVELLSLVSEHSNIHGKNVVEEMAKAQNKTVLHLVVVIFV